jgi:hypothetical protein
MYVPGGFPLDIFVPCVDRPLSHRRCQPERIVRACSGPHFRRHPVGAALLGATGSPLSPANSLIRNGLPALTEGV